MHNKILFFTILVFFVFTVHVTRTRAEKQSLTEVNKILKDANHAFVNHNFTKAIDLYKQVLHMAGQIPGIHFNIGKSYYMLKNNNKAIKYFHNAIKIDPNYQRAYQSLGTLYTSKNKHKEAIVYLQKAIELKKDDYIAHMNLASNLLSLQAYTHAEKYYMDLQPLFPNKFDVFYNTAYSMKLQGKYQESIPYYLKAIDINPNREEPYLGLAKAYLATGNLLEGWNYFEWRFLDCKKHNEKFFYKNLSPKDLAGKILYIRGEWGLGDMIHFIRYLQLAKQEGATVYLQIHKPLEKLFSLCPYIDRIIPHGDKIPHFDIQMPVMSLPLLFKTTLETIPANIPYLYANQELVKLWREKLAHDKNFKIGICWHAKPIFLEENYLTRRSIPLNDFAILADIPNVSFYSLQKIYGTKELENIPSHFKINTFGPDFDESHGRFMDTAAVIQNLDLVITADTSIVHLAGALGKPVWILIPYVPEWRWMQNTDKTPWYPKAKLLRQEKPIDWTHVMKKVKKLLEHVTTNKRKEKS